MSHPTPPAGRRPPSRPSPTPLPAQPHGARPNRPQPPSAPHVSWGPRARVCMHNTQPACTHMCATGAVQPRVRTAGGGRAAVQACKRCCARGCAVTTRMCTQLCMRGCRVCTLVPLHCVPEHRTGVQRVPPVATGPPRPPPAAWPWAAAGGGSPACLGGDITGDAQPGARRPARSQGTATRLLLLRRPRAGARMEPQQGPVVLQQPPPRPQHRAASRHWSYWEPQFGCLLLERGCYQQQNLRPPVSQHLGTPPVCPAGCWEWDPGSVPTGDPRGRCLMALVTAAGRWVGVSWCHLAPSTAWPRRRGGERGRRAAPVRHRVYEDLEEPA